MEFEDLRSLTESIYLDFGAAKVVNAELTTLIVQRDETVTKLEE